MTGDNRGDTRIEGHPVIRAMVEVCLGPLQNPGDRPLLGQGKGRRRTLNHWQRRQGKSVSTDTAVELRDGWSPLRGGQPPEEIDRVPAYSGKMVGHGTGINNNFHATVL